MRKSWRELEKDHDAHVIESESRSSTLESRFVTELSDLRKDFKDFRADVQPVIDLFKSISFTLRGGIKAILLFGTVVAIFVGLKTLGIHL